MLKQKAMLSSLLAGLSISLVACGQAATPTLSPTAPPTQGPTIAATAAATSTPRPTVASTPTPPPTALASPEVNPGKLVWMVQGWGAGRFENALGGGGVSNQYARIMHGFLIAADPSGKMTPGIAEDWSVSTDGKTWTVTVRDGALFHDGKPVTSADVAWSWTHEWAPEAVAYGTTGTNLAQARNTERIEMVGTNQVRATLKTADAGFPAGILSEAGPNWIGSIYPGRDKPYDEAASAAYDKAPVGAGPMKVISQVPGELIGMERFDDFYYQPENGLPEDRRVSFKLLDLRQVPEISTRVAALRAGEADIAPVSLDSRPQVEAGGGRLVFGPEGVFVWPIFYGCWSPIEPPCRDKRVRQAFAYALDKELIRDRLYGGPEVFEVRGWTSVTPGSIGYSPDLDPYPFDPAKARQLLAEAGYPNGEGFGKFVVNTWVSSAMPFLPEQAQLAADTWRRELSLDIEVKIGDQTALNLAEQSDELWGQMTYRDNEARYDGGSALRSSYGTPGQGSRKHDDPEVFAQVQAALATTDPEAYARALNSVYKRLWEEQWSLGVGYVNIPWGVGPKVTAWQPFRFSFYPSGLHTIRVK